MRKNSILLALAAAAATACSGNELVGIHVQLQPDGSGVVTTRTLSDAAGPSPAETRAQGVAWTGRAALLCSQGTFKNLGELAFGNQGLRFKAKSGDDHGVRVMLQRGPDVEWIKALVPDAAARVAMAPVYEPKTTARANGRAKPRELGDVIRLEIALPAEANASNVLPGGRGVAADRDGKTAYLTLPVATVLEPGDEFVWDITWR
jgi:hypothetical protein